MARNETVDLSPDSWTQLTSGDVSALRAQNLSGYFVKIMATADTTAPANEDGHLVLAPMAVLAADLTLADLFPGVTSAARVWGKGTGSVSVSHA